MAKPDKAESIDGFKYRTHQKLDGYWVDPFQEHDFWSRTFMPGKTKYIEAQDEEEMKTKLKADRDTKFKESELSNETKDKFEKDKDLKDKVEKEAIGVNINNKL